jgi:uncharacterized protein YkwD
MDRKMLARVCVLLGLLALPAAANADAGWTCSASSGRVATDAAAVGGNPCPQAGAPADGVTGLMANGQVAVDGGAGSQTIDTRTPKASVDLKTATIRNADGSLTVEASNLSSQATGACDPSRQPAFTSSGKPGSVTLNGRPIDTGREYTEPGVGVNGAPLFGKITIRFGEVTKTDTGISRRELHVIVTDRDGAVVFEAIAGIVAVGRDGSVCDPPPLCPQAERCVDVVVAPLPPPPPPVSVNVAPPKRSTGCRDANSTKVSAKRIEAATLCLVNGERHKRHLSKLRASTTLRRAAASHAADMVKRHYFAHGDVLARILHSGYLGRFGNWHVGENLGWGWGRGASPRAMVRAWMRSPSHRRNILGRKFRDVGIAVLRGSPGRRKPASITYVSDFGGFS